ncbi:uncharacterized protein LOC117644647, partial [Thrips palmi]|uniref:Uncharacterized protein LOC117644647 n=1 Tax=Thrips palmi TaxID=161013 RepID=A0A6P8YJV1_THRPL
LFCLQFQRPDEPECSEVCQCHPGDSLSCNTVCVARTPCRTEYAFYNHASPAYQAYRGRCLCYSGRFICMRPAPDSYSLPEGVFLFVGYSEREEALLQELSNLTVADVAATLQEHMRTAQAARAEHNVQASEKGEAVEDGHGHGEVLCSLLMHNVTRENLILVAKLVQVNVSEELSAAEALRREKEECVGPLHDIVEKINSRHPDFHSHLLLSILKLGLVEVRVPDRTASSSAAALGTPLPLLASVLAACVVARFSSLWSLTRR